MSLGAAGLSLSNPSFYPWNLLGGSTMTTATGAIFTANGAPFGVSLNPGSGPDGLTVGSPLEAPVFTATSMLSGALTLNVGDVVNRIQLSQGADFVTVNAPEAAPDIDAVSSE